jgi:hypothetical protein
MTTLLVDPRYALLVLQAVLVVLLLCGVSRSPHSGAS